MNIKIEKKYDEVVFPLRLDLEYGFDIRSNERMNVKPGEIVTISSGVNISIPEDHYVTLYSRPNVAKDIGLNVLGGSISINGPFDGELKVTVKNETGRLTVIEKTFPLARMVVSKKEDIVLVDKKKFKETDKNESKIN